MNKSPTERTISAMTRYEKSISGIENEEFLLGQNTSRIYFEDPKLLLFTLSRYKFVSKMFAGRERVLEIGCQEGFGSQLVSKTVQSLHCIDFYRPHIDSCNRRFRSTNGNMTFECADILDGLESRGFDGAFALDVLEHIDVVDEDRFISAILSVLKPDALVIFGMPSLESQAYASARSREGHVNCKQGDELRRFLQRYLRGVMIFSMNDEVLHTGFFPMSQYIFGVGWYGGR
jgi:2-polyprenyl-3-methyl-5-hydroxy-6-metoxy-1,4-benzoquinol methylase